MRKRSERKEDKKRIIKEAKMSIQITPIVGSATKKDILEFKVRGQNRWALVKLGNVIEKWCVEQDIKINMGW